MICYVVWRLRSRTSSLHNGVALHYRVQKLRVTLEKGTTYWLVTTIKNDGVNTLTATLGPSLNSLALCGTRHRILFQPVATLARL